MVRWVFTSGDVVAEKPQFFSLADGKAFFDNLGYVELENLVQHSF
jgi:hypothetical protein